MAEFSGFFNSEIGDVREYNASEFAEYFSRFLSDGLYSTNNKLGLKVTSVTGMDIKVDTGYAYIRGYMYKNDSPINLVVDAPDNVLSRIDRVVLKFDVVAREIRVLVKKGVFSSSPLPPNLVNDQTTKELSLAQIYVAANTKAVSVTDERLTSHCGVVSLLVDVPLDDMYAEWEQWKRNNSQSFSAWRTVQKDEYQAWLATIEELLDANVAGNLNNLIQANTTAIGTNTSAIATNTTGLTNANTEIGKKMDKSKITISSLDADINQMAEGDIWIKYE